MSQGLLMFDSSKRIVICNRQYIEIYGLSPEIVKPGCTFRELHCHRKENGKLRGRRRRSIVSTSMRALSREKTTSRIVETPHGRARSRS